MDDVTGYHHTHATQSPKVLFIDSKDATQRHQGETTSFTYVFRDSIIVQRNEGVLLSLLQASIPYSFYNVREGVNDAIDIIVSETTSPVYHELVIKVEPGNYTETTLATQFKALLESGLSSKSLPSTVTIEYDTDKQKFKFSITATGTHDGRRVILNLSHGNNKNTHFDVELGFDSDVAKSSVYFQCDSSVAGESQSGGNVSILDGSPTNFTQTGVQLIAPNVADLNGSVHSLYLRTNLPVLSTMDSLTGSQSNIVAKIPINVGPGGIISLQPRDCIHKSLIHPQSIKALQIRITDDRNRVVSLNGLHFSIALQFEFVSIRRNVLPLDPRITSPKFGMLRGDFLNRIGRNNLDTNSINEAINENSGSRVGKLSPSKRPTKIRKSKGGDKQLKQDKKRSK